MKKVLILIFVFISCQNNEKFDLLDYNEFKKQVEECNTRPASICFSLLSSFGIFRRKRM